MKVGKTRTLFAAGSAALLCLVACDRYTNHGHGPEKRCKMDINTLTSALRGFEMDAGFLPTTEQGLDALVHEPTQAPVPKRWRVAMKKMIEDPWGRAYQYRQPGLHNPDTFDIWTLGPDGIESEDDVGNWD